MKGGCHFCESEFVRSKVERLQLQRLFEFGLKEINDRSLRKSSATEQIEGIYCKGAME